MAGWTSSPSTASFGDDGSVCVSPSSPLARPSEPWVEVDVSWVSAGPSARVAAEGG